MDMTIMLGSHKFSLQAPIDHEELYVLWSLYNLAQMLRTNILL